MSEREILFRGKRVGDGEWIEGYFLPGSERQSLHPCIFVYLPETQSFECFDIDIDTLGEYTGLEDRSGTRIFEGDIVLCQNYHGKVQGIVDYNNSYFYLACSSGYSDEYLFNCSEFEVVGNIYDNPELMRGEK